MWLFIAQTRSCFFLPGMDSQGPSILDPLFCDFARGAYSFQVECRPIEKPESTFRFSLSHLFFPSMESQRTSNPEPAAADTSTLSQNWTRIVATGRAPKTNIVLIWSPHLGQTLDGDALGDAATAKVPVLRCTMNRRFRRQAHPWRA